MSDQVSLTEIIEKQVTTIQTQIEGLNKARTMCERMFEGVKVSFLYLWGSLITWTVITSLCLLVGILSYIDSPPEIPVQWNKGIAVSFVNKNFIFIYPLACIIIEK